MGDWPEQLIHFDIRRDEEKMVVNQFIVDFMNLELTKENIFIIYGKNITLIVNKPNDNYYFLTNNAETDSPILSICSNLTSDETKLFEGVKTYFINQPFNPQRIGELVYFLENPVKVRVVALNESMIESQNVSITPIYEGYFLGLTKQLRGYNAEIIVKVKADELKKIIEQNQTLEDLNFTYLLQDGVNRTIPVSFDKKTREYRFSETIPLMGNPVYYPIDEYENAIYLNPPRFIEKPETSQSDGFIIQSDFSNDRVKITVKRDVCLRYALGLIVSIICSCFLIRYIKQPNTKISRPETQMKIIAFIFGCVLFGLISFVSLDLLKSIGILPFGIILIVLSGFAYKKIRK